MSVITALRHVAKDTPIVSFLPEYAIFAREEAKENTLLEDREFYLSEIESTLKQKAQEMKDVFTFLKSELLKGGNADSTEKTLLKKACFSSIVCSISGLDNIIQTPIWQSDALSDKAINDCFTTFCENPNVVLLSNYDLSDVW